ncbi:E3 ubiquitin-protein ligase TRIM11-like [Clinocottus analis]|uniref:E3 ubiquitin-protein ligase TRIM11-like n=1 Tax=Clinocottus analis TaxID=304258 RepID=UPI0035C23937
MSPADYLPTEEQLSCCICPDVFNDPVTVPSGHNFCKKCITQHLNSNSQRQRPPCKENEMSEVTRQYRRSAGRKEGRGDQKFRLFSVYNLLCLTVCFIIALMPHQTVACPKSRRLFDAVENAVGGVCPKHAEPLELYCKKEQMLICQSCADSTHRYHDVVPLKEEYEAKIRELQETKTAIQQKIHERQRKIQKVKRLVLANSEATDREKADGVQVFTAWTKTLEEIHAKVIGVIEVKHQTTQKQAEDFTQELEQEISELKQRWIEVEQLSHSKDHLHFLQSFPFLNTDPLAGDLPDVRLPPSFYEDLLTIALEVAVDQLTETVEQEMKKLQEAQWLHILQYAVDVTLDPDTAHPDLIVSDDGKRVHDSDVTHEVSDNPKRFDRYGCVLGKQNFSSGRFYYDVQVKGKTDWVLGVAKESVDRKGDLKLNPDYGIWSLEHVDGDHYFQFSSEPYRLPVKDKPEKVGIFVDFEEDLVSFYNVDSAALIYSFTGCSFTERLHPFFCPYDSIPLIIASAVS